MTTTINGVAACVMAPASGLLTDVRRAREFYRYLQPDNLVLPHLRRRSSTFDVHHDHIPSLSSALSPFCQLVALRCNAAKAMLNVMDRDVMYFLAEASCRPSEDGGKGVHDFVEDPIFLECSAVPLHGRICEMTLKLDRPEDTGRTPSYVIPDLTKSPFAHMSIIQGPPYYRFYAGVPITTRGGVNIGSIAIMDTEVRPDGLTRSEEEFLSRTAEQIMTYLETNRQAIEGRRSRKMAEGLEAFISGKRGAEENGTNAWSSKTLRRRAKAAYGIALEADNGTVPEQAVHSKSHGPYSHQMNSDSAISIDSDFSSSTHSSGGDDQQDSSSEGDLSPHSKTFARAANLLRECLGDLGDEGSVHFLSLATRLGCGPQKLRSANGSGVNLTKLASTTGSDNRSRIDKAYRSDRQCRVMSSSTLTNPVLKNGEDEQATVTLEDEMLRDFMRRYPGGHLWTMDDAMASSSEDDFYTNGDRETASRARRRSSRRKHSELAALREAFPAARQVLFAPVWDATIGSFTYGCFIVSAIETRSFSTATELPFLNSFCSTVMAECSRYDTMMADKQKSDFVGTISHEMRSPLHGVLASVEFLADTDLTSFQKSLIETIDSCGRTLLDTINHVLDFSKVNSFQKQWQASNKKSTYGGRRTNFLGPENSSRAVSHGAPPLLQLFGLTDVSAVLEEVVDGLVLGHTYNSGMDITDTSREARGRANGRPTATKPDDVEIILNVEQGDWTFMTQPGAVRRIIMNITGNAIKYTIHGRIEVGLRQKTVSGDDGSTRLMVFTVTDTGKGISPEFLASRLFVPFAQENALAPGTGLGMSIVRSIVLMLGGTIDVQSRVGKGTTVEVALPMKRPLPGQVSSQTTPHSGGTGVSGHSTGDDSIQLLQHQGRDESVSFFRPKPRADDPLVKAVQSYVHDWYGLECKDQGMLESSTVVIVEEEDLEHLMSKVTGTPGKRPGLVIMCSVSSRHSARLTSSLEERLSSPVEFVAKPCGPNKLARSIRQALEKKRAIKPRLSKFMNLDMIPEVLTPNEAIPTGHAFCPAGQELKELDLGGPGERGQVVQATETFAASQISQHAQMAIHPSPGMRTPKIQSGEHEAFPFPAQQDETTMTPGRDGVRSRGASVTTSSEVTPIIRSEAATPQAVQTTDPASAQIDPYILLVDDNRINLKLLETFLKKKRTYTRIVKAEDGQQAVDAVMGAEEQFDIIFMDISMPVMNGFEATRAIRDFEERQGSHPGAMIIALTGLASGRDQSEGFDSGCDIYMTKPVSFKEVGKLLDNWEGHQLAGMEQSVSEDLARLKLSLNSSVNVPTSVNGGHTL